MASIFVHSLSSLEPVEFVYDNLEKHKLAKQLLIYEGGLGCVLHEGLSSYQDATLSNKTCLMLTENIPLNKILEPKNKKLTIENVSGAFYLKTDQGEYLTLLDDEIFVGGKGEKILFNASSVGPKLVELKIDSKTYLQVEKEYPFQLKTSGNPLIREELSRQTFEIDFSDGNVSFRTKTKEGWRYLSWGCVDKVVRATGLTLNETVINSYKFICEFVTKNEIMHGFIPSVAEINYFNSFEHFENNNNINIQSSKEKNVHLLLTCSTADITKYKQVPVNISLTKTNFSSSGSYNSSVSAKSKLSDPVKYTVIQ